MKLIFEEILKKVESRIADRLHFEYHDWDDMIEDGEATHEEITNALSKLKIVRRCQ